MVEEEIRFDSYGRMRYHPEFHPNHGVKMDDEELAYLCYYYEHDNKRSISFALGRTEHTLRAKVNQLKKKGLYEKYRELYKEKWEKAAN